MIRDFYKIYKSSIIGKGGYAVVYRGKNRLTKEKVAIKVFNKKKMKQRDIIAARREA